MTMTDLCEIGAFANKLLEATSCPTNFRGSILGHEALRHTHCEIRPAALQTSTQPGEALAIDSSDLV